MTRRRPHSQQGFTILEVLIALAILTMMMLLAWSVTSQILRGRTSVNATNARSHEIRVAMNRMVKDISMAYLSNNEPKDVQERRTFFIGKDSGEYKLRFSAFAHQVMWADANESEQTIIAYYLANDPDDTRRKNLLRREARRLSYEGWEQEPAEIDVLVHDVERIEFEYWDWQDKEWRDEWDGWDANNAKGRLPYRVRIKLTVMGNDRKELVFQTQARIHMSESLEFYVR